MRFVPGGIWEARFWILRISVKGTPPLTPKSNPKSRCWAKIELFNPRGRHGAVEIAVTRWSLRGLDFRVGSACSLKFGRCRATRDVVRPASYTMDSLPGGTAGGEC